MTTPRLETLNNAGNAVPPHAWFTVSALFHYLGPAFAVLLFPVIGILGVAWFRIASAAVIFSMISNPMRTLREASHRSRLLLLALGACLAIMNTSFYLALDRLPMSLVAAMEFSGTMILAVIGLRSWRNFLAVVLVITGVLILIDVAWVTDLIGLSWAALNACLFTLYIVLGHRLASDGAGKGVENLGAAMAIALIVLLPIGFVEASKAFGVPVLILAGIGVGVCSSVIPYVCDQLAMARLPRSSFALLLALLPAMATVIGAIVLKQIPSASDMMGVGLVVVGVAIHLPPYDGGKLTGGSHED